MSDREPSPDPKELEAAMLARTIGERARLPQEAKGKRMGRGDWLLVVAIVVIGGALVWHQHAVRATLHHPTLTVTVSYLIWFSAIAAQVFRRIERRLDALIRLLEERSVV